MTSLTPLSRAIFITSISLTTAATVALADDERSTTFSTTVKASSEHADPIDACQLATDQAESEALLQAEEHFTEPFTLSLETTEQTQRSGQDGKTLCEFTGTWTGLSLNSASALIGQEMSVNGTFAERCPDDRNSDLCWSGIIEQAAEQLRAKLASRHDNVEALTFRYVEFEGWQRDRYQDRSLEVTADGTFYFDVLAAGDYDATISLERSWDRPDHPAQPTEPETSDQPSDQNPPKAAQSDPDVLDMTLFYVWDGNDRAASDVLAISAERWGAGLWANNRLGFTVFKGTDQLGIGDDDENVKTTRQHYDTLGVGMGYRLWANRAITLENMLYYVDAEPFQGTVAPDCDRCTPRTFRSDNYAQTTVNLKTNSKGLNVGWMFTWKFLETESALDKLSSGFYLELQF